MSTFWDLVFPFIHFRSIFNGNHNRLRLYYVSLNSVVEQFALIQFNTTVEHTDITRKRKKNGS